MQVDFYHLKNSPFESSLQSLLRKAVDMGNRVVLFCHDMDKLKKVSDVFWKAAEKNFIPNILEGEKSEFIQDNILYLTNKEENPINANIIAVIGEVLPEGIDKFDRCLYMFNDNIEPEITNARKSWKNLDCSKNYWSQNDKGKWVKMDL